ncbi:hypothetical protein [Streptomyces sp. WAC00263]|uniref:hypothetical protein n=1 Tax=Streptomyces sp. WAC00263 TaxID=1917422 RepID=UPI0015EE494B|nr:hypothetical protein [Streptomyces sp. WAC00263]
MMRLYNAYLWHLSEEIWSSETYRVLDGAEETLRQIGRTGLDLAMTVCRRSRRTVSCSVADGGPCGLISVLDLLADQAADQGDRRRDNGRRSAAIGLVTRGTSQAKSSSRLAGHRAPARASRL